MSRIKNPKLKKINEYEKDHRTAMEHPHAFRKNWPKKKARLNRRHRHSMKAVVQTDEDVSSASLQLLKKRGMLRKNGVTTLAEKVQRDKVRRANPPRRQPNLNK